MHFSSSLLDVAMLAHFYFHGLTELLDSFWIWIVLGIVLCTLITWTGLTFFITKYCINRRTKPYHEELPENERHIYSSHELTTCDQQTIACWYAEGAKDYPIAVLVHGNQNDRSQCLPYAKVFQERGCGTLLISMRAHGESSGQLNDFGYGARNDVVAAVEFIRQRYLTRPIMLFGISAGATAVSFAAKELGPRISSVIMEEPFLNIMAAVKRRTELLLPAVLSYLVFASLVFMARWILPHFKAIAPIDAVKDINGKAHLWILAGGKDEKALLEETRRIYEAAHSQAQLVIFPEAKHESLLEHNPSLYRELVNRWVNQVRDHQER